MMQAQAKRLEKNFIYKKIKTNLKILKLNRKHVIKRKQFISSN